MTTTNLAQNGCHETEMKIYDEYVEAWRGYYAEIPRCVIQADITHEAFRLYCYYKDTCGPKSGGVCFKSYTTVCRELHMDRRTLKKKRDELEEAGLIHVSYEIMPTGYKRVNVMIVNVWDENAKFCTPSTATTRSTDVQYTTTTRGGTQQQLGGYTTTTIRITL